ncbi:hypothetical protein [Aquimarina sp. RZ0]|uniref:hypothetical protein n=1 Tax=Aquimarina sp. RZ0 TaxID=2607730 RepID=UPI0011F36171|nr:hypothetical protein [Aquimarina sp. RZ0]KAA1245809.1 hypothetical protein F0000_10435 [Aquimarina sp. RZ0]
MRTKEILTILYFCVISSYGQKIDISFGRNGLLVFKELGMVSSNIVDFEILEDDRINVFFESDAKRYLMRLNQKGIKKTIFEIDDYVFDNQYVTPISIRTKPDGGIFVLSNRWNGNNWVIVINSFLENGEIDQNFGNEGVYEKNILDNEDNNYGERIYISSKDEIIVVAKVSRPNGLQETENIAILKVSEFGTTLSSELYNENFFSFSCSTMNNDRLLLAYSESFDNGVERSTYLVDFDSEEMISNNLDCLNIESEYQSFNQLVATGDDLYVSNIQSDMDNLYTIRRYDVSGGIEDSFINSVQIDFNADIYNTDFVVDDKGETFIVSASLESEKEILIKKLGSDGKTDKSFGSDGVAAMSLKYPIEGIDKIRLDAKGGMYVSGKMAIMGSSFGFITKLKLNVQELKKEQLEKFMDELFKKG